MSTRSTENIGIDFGEPLFEIAVYRVSPTGWDRDLEGLRRRAEELVGQLDGLPERRRVERVESMTELLLSEVGDMPYGQAVGWLRILHDSPGAAIKGYGYLLPQKQFRVRFKQSLFRETGKEIEVSFQYSQSTTEEIAEALRTEIVATTHEGRVFHGRWLDMAAFDKVAPMVRWRALLGLDDRNRDEPPFAPEMREAPRQPGEWL